MKIKSEQHLPLWISLRVVSLFCPYDHCKYLYSPTPRCAPLPPAATTSEEPEATAGRPPRSPASLCPASPARMSRYRSRWRNASPCPGRAASLCPRSLASRCLRRPAPPCQSRLPPRWPRRSAAVIQLGGRGGMGARRGGGK